MIPNFKPENFKPGARVLDDVAGLAGGAVNILSSIRHQIRNEVKARMTETVDRLDLVPREDFDRLEHQVKVLQDKIDQLETKKQPAPKTPIKKPATKKATAKTAPKKKASVKTKTAKKTPSKRTRKS